MSLQHFCVNSVQFMCVKKCCFCPGELPATVWAICFDFHLTFLRWLECTYHIFILFIFSLHPVNICTASQTVGASWRTLLPCYNIVSAADFSWTSICIFNLPLMNFQFDNWQNAAHEHAEATHMRHERARMQSSSIPLGIACRRPASEWLSLFAFLSIESNRIESVPSLVGVKC